MGKINRRLLLQTAAGVAASWALPVPGERRLPTVENANGAPDAMTPLKLGQVKAAGWLLDQLKIQADGMGGHLDEFWPDVGSNSGWLGGTGESWERGPYFLDGLYPLAVTLGDDRLLAKAMRYIEWSLTHQRPDGMFGPVRNEDWWPRMLMLKVMMQYHDATSDARVLPFLTRYFHYQLATMPSRPLNSWGRYRWQDEALVVTWLHRKTKDPKLMQLNELLQKQGYDWVEGFRNFPYKVPQTRELLKMERGADDTPNGMETHGVNNAMALKTAAVRFMMSGDSRERSNFDHQIEELYRYHGQPNGIFSCDEHLAGLNPSQGTELCTVVDTMYSLEVALAAFGDAKLADRLERIAYNALPGTFTDDMWAHQYDQQCNQVRVSRNSKPWTTNGPESNLYGPEPNFGCCTANFHQGWPKLTANLWMRTADDDGLAAVVWAPCEVNTDVRGAPLSLLVKTEYPFRDVVEIHVQDARRQKFPLHVRIPEWCSHARIMVNGTELTELLSPGTFHKIERTWNTGDKVMLNFTMSPYLTKGYNGAVTVNRGPLVFAYSPGEHWVKLRDRGPTADWQVFGDRPWNYALVIDDANIGHAGINEAEIGKRPFAAKENGLSIDVPARRFTAWSDVDGVANPPPQSLVKLTAPVETLRLIPYAAAKLRVSVFPQCDEVV